MLRLNQGLTATRAKQHPETAHFKDLINEIELNKNVLRLGFVSNEDLVVIYNLATVYCQPSFYEGFGLPVLEAMASGCPVVASKTQALVEVSGDMPIFFDPQDFNDMANKINLIFENKILRESLVKDGIRHSKNFSWSKVGEETIDIYKKVLKRQ